MLQSIDKILFLDIETASLYPDYDSVPEIEQELWKAKSQHLKVCENLTPAACYQKRASIYAEFAKILCISMGRLEKISEDTFEWHKKTITSKKSEADALEQFAELMNALPQSFKICGHNCKEFDLPFLARRFLIHQKPLPKRLSDLQKKKPWQTDLIDTMEFWKFGDIKNYTSLDLLAYLLGVPSPKNDLSGADIHNVYWQENDLDRIAACCEKDVYTTAKVYFKLSGHRTVDF